MVDQWPRFEQSVPCRVASVRLIHVVIEMEKLTQQFKPISAHNSRENWRCVQNVRSSIHFNIWSVGNTHQQNES